jgi:DNA ligase-1
MMNMDNFSGIKKREKIAIKVLLARTYEEGMPVDGFLMSEKLDGTRARFIAAKRKLFSRDGNEFKVPAWFLEGFPTFDLDGELWGGRGKFQQTVGIVKRLEEDAEWHKVKYHVFDAPTLDMVFSTRYDVLKDMPPAPNIVIVEHLPCVDLANTKEYFNRIIADGGEGIMLRDPNSKYDCKRSKTLLKMKKADDAEGLVVGHQPGEGKYVGMVGALQVRMKGGFLFNVGSGMSDADRANPPAIGSVITYEYNGLTLENKPRFPRFVRVREDVKWEDDKHV